MLILCAVPEKQNFRPAHSLKMTSPTGFGYMGHAEAIKVFRYQTHTHTCTYSICSTHTIHWPGIKESGAQDHDSLTGALFQLHLDGAELTVDDSHHALNLFGRDGPRTRLFPQQVHHMGSEFVARLPSDKKRDKNKKNSQSSVNVPNHSSNPPKLFDWYPEVAYISHRRIESITRELFWLKASTDWAVYILPWWHNRWSHLWI